MTIVNHRESTALQKELFSNLVNKMAVPLDTVKAVNAELKSLDAGQVGVFVGGTAGIGEFALKAFARRTKSPKIYIVGRYEPVSIGDCISSDIQ